MGFVRVIIETVNGLPNFRWARSAINVSRRQTRPYASGFLEYTVGGYSHPMDLPHALARRAFRGTYDKLRALITNKRLLESTAVGPHN